MSSNGNDLSFSLNQNSTLMDTTQFVSPSPPKKNKKNKKFAWLLFRKVTRVKQTKPPSLKQGKWSPEPDKLFDEPCRQRTSEVFHATNENRRGEKNFKYNYTLAQKPRCGGELQACDIQSLTGIKSCSGCWFMSTSLHNECKGALVQCRKYYCFNNTNIHTATLELLLKIQKGKDSLY